MKPNIALPQGGLYLITPDEADNDRFLAVVSPLLRRGIAVLQYRNKLANSDQMREQAMALQEQCRHHGIVFIINDNIELALELDADGVHLGEHDGNVREARERIGPEMIIGASCYDSLELAEKASVDGANYIAFGAVYPSATKPQARKADPSLFAQAGALALPMVAIGGITPDNAAQTLAAGANFLAVIGAVFDADDPSVEITKFISRFNFPESINEYR